MLIGSPSLTPDPGFTANDVLNINSNLNLASQAEYISDGGIDQCAGVNSIGAGFDALQVGASGNGSYNLGGTGSLYFAGSEEIVEQADGAFVQSGGVNNAANFIYMGSLGSDVTGSYTLTNGTLGSASGTMRFTMLQGSFAQSGGVGELGEFDIEGDKLPANAVLSGGSTSAASVYVGGNSEAVDPGTGTLTVSGSGLLSVAGTLTIYNSSSNVHNTVNLEGGTIEAAAYNFDGLSGEFQPPSSLNWVSGTLGILGSVSWTPQSPTTSTGGMFGFEVSLINGQVLAVSGDEYPRPRIQYESSVWRREPGRRKYDSRVSRRLEREFGQQGGCRR